LKGFLQGVWDNLPLGVAANTYKALRQPVPHYITDERGAVVGEEMKPATGTLEAVGLSAAMGAANILPATNYYAAGTGDNPEAVMAAAARGERLPGKLDTGDRVGYALIGAGKHIGLAYGACKVADAIGGGAQGASSGRLEWRGSGPPESGKGMWVDANTGEKFYLNMNHPPPKGPHVDYYAPGKPKVPLFPDVPYDGP